METLGKSFLMVIEPSDFDLNQQKVFYSDFGFVIASESEFFRDAMIKLCHECHKVRKNGFGPKIITNIRERMKEIVRRTLKDERVYLELVALFFDIVYYTSVSHDKDAHLRKFSVFEGVNLRYFGYCGTRDYNSMKLIEKVRERIHVSEEKNLTGSYFEILQVVN